MDAIASDRVMDEAFVWLREHRKDYAPGADVWDVRWRRAAIRPLVQQSLREGDYRLCAVSSFTTGGDTREVWSARDALVLKATTIVLTRHLRPHLSRRCYHLAGGGGAKAAVRAVADHGYDELVKEATMGNKYPCPIPSGKHPVSDEVGTVEQARRPVQATPRDQSGL